MAFTPKNYVDNSFPQVSAAWLNALDVLGNSVFQSATTPAQALAALGLTGFTLPLPINLGGTGVVDAVDALAALGGIGPIPQTTAEQAAGLTIADNRYHPGNFLRYGIVPNSSAAGVSNMNILFQLLNWNVSVGPTGLLYSPNTGTSSSAAADTYYFTYSTSGQTKNFALIRDGITLDLNGCTWIMSKSSYNGDVSSGFLWAMRNVTIQNGSILANYTDAGSGPYPGNIGILAFGGRDGSPLNSNLPTIYDSLLPPFVASHITMGNITLRNLYLSGTTNVSTANMGFNGIFVLGGVNGVRYDNVTIEGNNQLVMGTYYEFGFATNDPNGGGGSRSQRQSSHAHDWKITNYKVRNLSASAIGNAAFTSNGGYGMSFDNVDATNCPCILALGTGESAFFQPWVGVDDLGSLPQNGASPLAGTAAAGRPMKMSNIKGRGMTGTAISIGGDTATSGWSPVLPICPAWQPNTVYGAGATAYNGAYKYSTVAGGTSSNAAGFAGPKGTSPAIDGTITWVFVAYAGGTGYFGWQSGLLYHVNDIAVNGQYIYICTTQGQAGGTFQGPTGVGTGLTDGSGGASRWSSIPSVISSPLPANSAYPAFTDQLNFTLDGFSVDSTSGSGYGVLLGSGQSIVRQGKITNFTTAVRTNSDATSWTLENLTCLNSTGLGMVLGTNAGSVWTPNRLSLGIVRNCFIAGSTGGAIATAQCAGILIENNRFGYEVAHDGIAESTQTQAVNVTGSTNNNVVCKNNYVAGVAGGAIAYILNQVTGSQGCVIDNPNGISTYSGPWEGVLQQGNVTLTCATPGNLTVNYNVQKIDYIKKGTKIDFTLEISTSLFTWSTASGNVSINGLPYPMNNVAVGSLPVMATNFQGITKASYTQVAATTSGGSSALQLDASGSGQAVVALAIADFPSGGTVKLFIAGSYFTN